MKYDNYKPVPIPLPVRQRDREENTVKKNEHVTSLDFDPFIQIELPTAGTPPQADTPTVGNPPTADTPLVAARAVSTSATVPAKPQPISPEGDERRELFYAMWRIARETYTRDEAVIFHKQAMLMRDFEDDYAEDRPFSAYYPYYQLMNHEQLRTYFTWRTGVRRGEIKPTSLSYAFLYIYELLGNIGVENPQDGLDRLMLFREKYRQFDTAIDKYLPGWLKDYHVYYTLPEPFADFADRHGLKSCYPEISCYESGREDSFELYSEISRYNIKKSAFYSEDTRQMINDCFFFVLDRLRGLFAARKKRFEDLVFRVSREAAWNPFSHALFHSPAKQPDRRVELSAAESYTCADGFWKYTAATLTEPGRLLVGYIMKEMEVSLRKLAGFKYKLTASQSVCDSSTLKKLYDMKLPLPAVIREATEEYFRLLNRKEVTVDFGNLERIRRDALSVQEKLIVEEAELFETEPPAGQAPVSDVPTKEAQTVPVAEPAALASEVPSGWASLRDGLTATELEAVRLILSGGDVRPLAAAENIMLEVLVDSINQKAVDCVGDTVLELGDSVEVYDDYRADITEMVK